MRWQQYARIGVVAFGIAVSAALYVAIGRREPPREPPPAPARIDPKAVIESSGAVAQQIRGVKEDYQVTASHQLTYEGGSIRSFDVEISVKDRGGRDFIISAKEAQSGERQSSVELSGAVVLTASDGFQIHTEHASFTEAEGLVRAPGPFTFNRGAMSGSGRGMVYDKNLDVLTIGEEAHVVFTKPDGVVTTEFSGGTSVFSRQDHRLTVERQVHVRRGEQEIDGAHASAMLTQNDDQVTYLELRGDARVSGGTDAFDAMSASDIDLDYTDDGLMLEFARLKGKAAIALRGIAEGPGRQILAESMNLAFAPDRSLTNVSARGAVRLELPASASSPRRAVTAASMDATGQAGEGLTAAMFQDNVEYIEEARPPATRRVARSRALTVGLRQDDITRATFTGAVSFVDGGLTASAPQADYNPIAGSLHLSGTGTGGPQVADRQITISATAIDVSLNARSMAATGSARTVLHASAGQDSGRLPGLLEQGQSVQVNAQSLQYDEGSGHAAYAGDVQLWQGDTTLRSTQLVIDRTTGDLVATGSARATVPIGADLSVGRAAEIRYVDARRELEYRGTGALATQEGRSIAGVKPLSPARSRTTAPSPTPPARAAVPQPNAAQTPSSAAAQAPAQLTTMYGDLRGDRILMTLMAQENSLERLDAFGRTTLKLDTRTATGARLVYTPKDERYVLTGLLGEPVRLVQRCDDTRGQSLTFFRSTDRIVVDGNEEIRTQTTSTGGACPDPRTP